MSSQLLAPASPAGPHAPAPPNCRLLLPSLAVQVTEALLLQAAHSGSQMQQLKKVPGAGAGRGPH